MSLATLLDINPSRPGFAPARPGPSAGCAPAPADRVLVTLARWRVASLRTRGPAEIHCRSGQLWITVPGEQADVVLQAGQKYRVAHATGDLLLSTVGARCPATVEVLPAGPARHGFLRSLLRHSPYLQLEFG
ncbi:MAG TPA: DUF2917 domain-containing protein [Noviherbaspirillum sp.]|uniref:DUF2917 domain-containing protein n=1 Tax=Noviherbaspirillum sp. TaxID=1926288 RepID=UPI002D496C82|nr:DUF2917 domain-containing protein [Noviherbaspirillum sp.]HYD95004.1 DUF2917 domain-containing protein [Noviherbaspirillum sp.]